MELVRSNLQGMPGPSGLGDRDASIRARARAAGLTIRLVLDGFTLGRPGGPRQRYDTVEALVARLEEVEAPNGRRQQSRG